MPRNYEALLRSALDVNLSGHAATAKDVKEYTYAVADKVIEQYIKKYHIDPKTITTEDRQHFRANMHSEHYIANTTAFSDAVLTSKNKEELAQNYEKIKNTEHNQMYASNLRVGGDYSISTSASGTGGKEYNGITPEDVKAARKEVEKSGIKDPMPAVMNLIIKTDGDLNEAKMQFTLSKSANEKLNKENEAAPEENLMNLKPTPTPGDTVIIMHPKGPPRKF